MFASLQTCTELAGRHISTLKLEVTFLPARCCANAVFAVIACMSVRPFLCHKPVLCQNSKRIIRPIVITICSVKSCRPDDLIGRRHQRVGTFHLRTAGRAR